jgi:hypothetical protein
MDAYRHLAVSYRIHQYMGDAIKDLNDYKELKHDSKKVRHPFLLGFKNAI